MTDENGNFNAALLDHVRQGSVELMPQSLLQNDNPDLIDHEGKTLLHYAAESNNVSMTRHFINNNHSLNIIDNDGNSPFMLAMVKGSYDTAKLLVKAGANMHDTASILLNLPRARKLYRFSKKYREFGSVMLETLKKNCKNDDRLLLTRLRDFGFSLFHAVAFKDAFVTRLMLTNGYLVNEHKYTENKYTPLHDAVSFGNVEIVKVLLEFGADVNASSKPDQVPPIYLLLDQLMDHQDNIDERLEILKMLIEHGALYFQFPIYGEHEMTPSLKIMRHAGSRAIKVLMQYNVDFYSYDALFHLVLNKNDNAVELLRGTRFDVNYTDNRSRPLLSCAIRWGSLRKVQFLLDHGADPNSVDLIQNETPLQSAVFYDTKGNTLAIIRLLLQYGADAQYSCSSEHRRRTQRTVFDLENTNGSEEVLEPIIAHLALIEDCGEVISELIRGKIDSRDNFKKHFQKCKKQIEDMKNTTVNGSVTLFNLLIESHVVITRYARDPEFTAKFEDAMKVEPSLDPYYSISLHERVGEAIQEAQLKQKAIVVMHKIFQCRLRNCTDIFVEILDYLTCDDLNNICKVYDVKSPNLPT